MSKWTSTAQAMALLRARTPRGKRAKALAVQWAAERLQPSPKLFTDLAVSLARDLVQPL